MPNRKIIIKRENLFSLFANEYWRRPQRRKYRLEKGFIVMNPIIYFPNNICFTEKSGCKGKSQY